VVTNVDEDHMGTYGGDFERLRATFLEFLHHLPFYGVAVLCIDDRNVRELLPELTRRTLTYGFSEDADVRASGLRQQGAHTHFEVSLREGPSFEVELAMPGRHNALNALAAISVGMELGLGVQQMQRSLRQFQGIGRRFQVRECDFDGGRLMLVDDYGHHPRELAATLEAVREGWPGRRLVLAFQPHRYSRTRDSFDDFASVLCEPDVLLLGEVFAAGEAPIAGADGRALSRAVRARGQVDPIFVEAIETLPEVLRGVVRDGDIVLTMGAGSIGQVAAELGERLCR
jgi:UDP-N-acetylmuramate--alanine ligase